MKLIKKEYSNYGNLLCISNGSEQENTAKYPGFSPYIGFSLKIGEIVK